MITVTILFFITLCVVAWGASFISKGMENAKTKKVYNLYDRSGATLGFILMGCVFASVCIECYTSRTKIIKTEVEILETTTEGFLGSKGRTWVRYSDGRTKRLNKIQGKSGETLVLTGRDYTDGSITMFFLKCDRWLEWKLNIVWRKFVR